MSFKQRYKIKSFIRNRFPRFNRAIVEPWLSWRYRRASSRFDEVTSKVIERYGLQIQGGPFNGLRYLSEAMHSGFASKILGCYESEIQAIIGKVCAEKHEVIIDVGCAEGYYAVGFASLLPNAKIYAYDIDARCRSLCHKLAELNKVADRLEIRTACSPAEFASFSEHSVFLLCDCEGFERELLNPELAPALKNWEILVELHDSLSPGITKTLVERFQSSHRINLIDSVERNPDGVANAAFLRSRLDRSVAVSDLRGSWQQWAWMVPKSLNKPQQ